MSTATHSLGICFVATAWVLLGPARLSNAEETWFVAPSGNNAWSGRLEEPAADGTDGPVGDLHRAVELARRSAAGAKRRIVLRAGEYFVTRPIELGPKDAGLTIEAAAGERVVLYGGRRITGWRRDGDRFWAADLPDGKSGKWDFRLLIVDGRMCPRARLPEKGTFTHLSTFDVPWMSTTHGGWKRKPTREELTTLKYRPEDLGPWLDVNNAEVTVYHMWDESLVGVERNDTEKHILTFSNPCGHPPGAFGVRKYVVWNVRRGMTRPGQWYLDRTAGRVVYWPLPGQDMAEAKALAPTVESIVRIAGRAGKPARDITIRRLTLAVTNTPRKAGGFGAAAFAGAVELTVAENCRLEDLEIVNVAGQGVRGWKLASCRIENCRIHDTGACGIRVVGECMIRNNDVHHVGRIYPSAIGIWGAGRGGPGCTIRHNTVHDTPYTAIACGGDGHRIENNSIYRAMLVLHDGAGIYVSMGRGMILRGNYVRDVVDTGGYGASAYYLDEQTVDCLVEGNLSVRVARPVQNHMARRNTIRGNVFVTDGDLVLSFPISSDYCLEKNVVVAGGKIQIANPDAISKAADNIFFSESGVAEQVVMNRYRKVKPLPLTSGKRWLLADPKMVHYESGRVRYAAGSPVEKRAIPPIDVSGAGCRILVSPDYEQPAGIEGAVLYDYDPATKLGDDVFGTVVADFSRPLDGRKRCSHGGPVCLEYPDGTLVAFYANTSSHNVDGWTEYALSKDKGRTWDKHHPFPHSLAAYEKNRKRPVWVEEGLVTAEGTVVLILTEFDGDRRVRNSVMRSKDCGATWSGPEPFADDAVGYPAAAAVAGSVCYVLLDSVRGPHELYVSVDDGKTWRRRSTLPLQKDAWYGALCVMEDGGLLAGAYVTQDEDHLYYCISRDGGRTWGAQRKAPLDKKIRDPELACLDGKYYLHGRSGHLGSGSHRFVLYQSDDGIHWKSGVIISGDRRFPDGYSHNCILNKYDADKPNELMIQYSIIYEPPRTSEYVFFIRPTRAGP